MKKGILFTADMHIRDTQPPCRTDDFMQAQWQKLKQVAGLVKKYDLYWVDCGDIFHTAKPSYKLLNEFIERMKTYDVCIDAAICGNHDMPAHNKGQIDDSAFGTLVSTGIIKKWLWGDGHMLEMNGDQNVILYGVNYMEEPYQPNDPRAVDCQRIMIIHEMFYEGQADVIKGVGGNMSDHFAQQFSEYDFIISGHNHRSFDRGAVHNVGSLTRQTADQVDHEPRVLIWSNGELAPRKLDYAVDVVSREHIEEQEKREDEISAFVETLGNIEGATLSFSGNVQIVLNKVNPNKAVRQAVQGAME